MTPDIYTDIFCQNAKKSRVIIEDCQKLEKFLKRLSPELQQTLKQRHIRSVEQLVQFMASELNRCGNQKSEELIQSYVLLVKRLLQAISMLHDRKAAKIAQEELSNITPYLSKEEVDRIREVWNRFVMEYDDTFLNRLEPFCKVDKEDLAKMVEDLIVCFSKEEAGCAGLEKLATVLTAALLPSIATGMNDDIAAVSSQIRANPELLTSDAMVEDLRYLVKKRVELDKKTVVSQMEELDSVIEHISRTLMQIIMHGESSHEAICKIQGELIEFDFKVDSYEVIHAKLLAIASSLETETRMFSEEITKDKEEVTQLRQKVRLLEEALRRERKRSTTDQLTRLPNRRAIDEFLAKQEAAYVRYGDNYAVVLFDIDHFKSVNDTYGHDAGDVILATFGRMLRHYSRELDFVGRWGGEEFLAILPKTDKEGAYRFAEKVREIVAKSKFMYKGTRIPITVSGGVADRASNPSMDAMLKKADENLYKAKKSGRNKIVM